MRTLQVWVQVAARQHREAAVPLNIAEIVECLPVFSCLHATACGRRTAALAYRPNVNPNICPTSSCC